MNTISAHIAFISNRLKIHLWILAALIICFIGHEFMQISRSFILLVILQLIAFRYLDEWGCRHIDLLFKKRVLPDKAFSFGQLTIALVIFLFSLYFHNEAKVTKVAFNTSTFVFVSFLIYMLFPKNILISLVSLLKYPYLILLITKKPTVQQIFLTLLVFIFLLVYELRNEKIFQQLGEKK